jgi:hypothetical protein
MSKKISLVVALAGMCALCLFLLNCGSSSSRPSGVLYVLTQGINGIGNNVSSFSIDFNTGNLSLINSNASTCPAGNNTDTNPCGIPLDILLDPTGATAFVLDQGVPCVQQGVQCVSSSASPVPPAIYPYTVNSDGSLSTPGTPITWTGNDTAVAMTRDAAGQFLFVINQGLYPPQADCPLSGAGCPSISVFTMQPGSTSLTLASGSPFYLSKLPTALSAIAFTPPASTTAQEFLYVTNNYDICTANCVPPSPHNDNTVSVYSVSSSGALTEQPNSPYAVAAVDPISVLAVNTNPAGENTGGLFVYVGAQNQNAGQLHPFQVCWLQNANCSQQDVAAHLMVPLATCPLLSCDIPPSSVGSDPVGMLVDPTNNFLYVVSELSNQVFGFRINTTAGTLTALNPPNQPTGTQPVSMAMHPSVNSAGQSLYSSSGQFLYTSNTTSSNITGFTLSTTSGAMSSPITVVAPAAPSGMAAH